MWLFGCLSRVVYLYDFLTSNCDTFSDYYLINRENDTSKLLQKTPTGRSNSSSVYKVDTYALQGSRPYMEDEYFVSHDGTVCAIFDGHGGSAVSRYVRSNFYANFQDATAEYMMKLNGMNQNQGWNTDRSSINSNSELDDNNNSSVIKQYKATTNVHVREDHKGEEILTNLTAHPRNKGVVPTMDACTYALRTAFRNIDQEVLRVNRWSFQGTTAVAVVIHDQGGTRRHIISVNIGDSRAVLSRRGIAIDLTTDHKPNDPNEKFRVEQLGGHVDWYGMLDDRTGEPLLDTGVFRINGNLAVSRSLGDRSERPFVSSEPDIKVFSILNDIDEFIVLASDGLFDVMSSQEVVSFLHQKKVTNLQKQDALAKTLAEEAIRRGSLDNISVIIVWLKKY
jgi:serine/threonine protein phosphatase PrpC